MYAQQFSPPGRLDLQEVSMRIISDLRIFRPRIAQLIALGGAITTPACKDAAAPPQTKVVETHALASAQSAAVDKLGSLSASLDDMTSWSVTSLPDGKGRENILAILKGLKANLKSGKIADSQQAVTDARALIESLSEKERVEIGAVGVALDLIQSELDKASQ
jgi:hypothetical protein